MAKVTGLSGNEIFCLALKSFSPGELVVGNSVQSMGFLGSLGAGFKNMVGGEVPQVTEAIHEGRAGAFLRMKSEAQQHGASGVAGVAGELRNFSGSTESADFSPAPATPRNSIVISTPAISRFNTLSAISPIPWASAAASPEHSNRSAAAK